MTILGLAESFKTLNRPCPTVTLLTAHFSESVKDKDVNFQHNLHFKILNLIVFKLIF